MPDDHAPSSRRRCADGLAEPALQVVGAGGSTLVVTRSGLTVCHCATIGSARLPCRTWDLGAIAALGLHQYGPLGAIVATLATGTQLPLLLLDTDHVPAARRVVDLLADPLARASTMRRTA